MKYFISRPNTWSMVAEVHGQFAGFVIAAVARRQPRTTNIVTVDVSDGHRRAGVGSALLAEVEARSRAAGCARVALEVAVDNGAAQSFYRRIGFEETGRIAGYYNGVLDALTMEKKLT